MRIITISREFGSGGRELGKRLADELGMPCYDHEIIDMIAEQHGFDKDYVTHISERDIRVFYPRTIAHRFAAQYPAKQQAVQIAVSEHEIIKQLASEKDCIIVGRCADVILHEMNPMSILVYANTKSKLARCKSRAEESEHFSEKDMLRKIRQIDKERAAYCGLFTEKEWGQKESYHLCINTTNKEIKTLIPGIATYVNLWFEQK